MRAFCTYMPIKNNRVFPLLQDRHKPSALFRTFPYTTLTRHSRQYWNISTCVENMSTQYYSVWWHCSLYSEISQGEYPYDNLKVKLKWLQSLWGDVIFVNWITRQYCWAKAEGSWLVTARKQHAIIIWNGDHRLFQAQTWLVTWRVFDLLVPSNIQLYMFTQNQH